MKKMIIAMCMSLAMGFTIGCFRVEGHYHTNLTVDDRNKIAPAVSNIIHDVESRGFVLSSLRIEYCDYRYFIYAEGLDVKRYCGREY